MKTKSSLCKTEIRKDFRWFRQVWPSLSVIYKVLCFFWSLSNSEFTFECILDFFANSCISFSWNIKLHKKFLLLIETTNYRKHESDYQTSFRNCSKGFMASSNNRMNWKHLFANGMVHFPKNIVSIRCLRMIMKFLCLVEIIILIDSSLTCLSQKFLLSN